MMLSLAVLVLSLMLTACHGATFGSRNHFRRHRPRGHRFRVGREKLDEVASTTTTVAPNVERYDLTSYGDNGVQQYEEPAIGYGAPGPEDDINDGYAGDVPGVGVNVGVSGNTQLDGAAADSFEASDKVNDEGDGNEYDDDVESVGRNDAIPPWCDPTNPMGAWLNYQKIQVISYFLGDNISFL